eukprot:g1973.t1
MLKTFGLEREGTTDCREVLKYVAERSSKEMCIPGAPVVEECEPPELTTDAPNDPQCPQTQYAPEVDGKVVLDYAYKGGRLRLSEVALNLQETFCVKQNCYRGVISAGGASGDDEKQVLFDSWS